MTTQIISKQAMETLAFEKLDAETQAEIMECKSSIDMSSIDSIMTYGAKASADVTGFSKDILKTFKVKDIPEVESLLPTLTNAFAEVDTQSLLPKKKGFFSRFTKSVDVAAFIQKFENVEQVVQGIQKKLQQVDFEIMRDVESEKMLGQKNLEFIKHLDCHIFALRMQYKEEMEKVSAEEAETDPNDVVAMHILAEHKEMVARLDRRAYNLELQRVEAIQSLPIIKELINGNVGLSEQIKMAISQGIPTWERNILIALQLHRQQGALRIEQAVHKMTNDLIRNNSHLLKENATTIAKAVEGGLIDIEALEEANKNILDTTRAVVQIANEAAQARQQNLDKLDGIVKELMEAETGRLVAPAFKMLDSNG